MVYNSFKVLLNSVSSVYFLEFLQLYLSGLLSDSFLFLYCLILSCYVQSNSLQNEYGSAPSSSSFWKYLKRIDISSFYNAQQNSPMKPIWFWTFFFLLHSLLFIQSLYSLLVCTDFPFLHDSDQVITVSRNLFIYSRLCNDDSFNNLLYFCGVSFNVSSFISDFLFFLNHVFISYYN